MVEERDEVDVPTAIQPFELAPGPLELRRIFRDVRIEREHERVAVPEGEHRIPVQPANRARWRNQSGHGSQIVRQTLLTFGRFEVGRAGHVMIAGREEVRHTAFGRQSIDQADEAVVPLRGVAAVHHRVAGLQDEPDRVRCVREPFDRRDHAVHDQRVFVLLVDAVPSPACVAVREKARNG